MQRNDIIKSKDQYFGYFSLEKNDFSSECLSGEGETAQLINVATGVVMPSDAAIQFLNSENREKQQLHTNVNIRLNSSEVSCGEPLPHLKIKILTSLLKKMEMPCMVSSYHFLLTS